MSAEKILDQWVPISPGSSRPTGMEEPREGVVVGYAGVMVELPIVYWDGKPTLYVPEAEGLAEKLWERLIPVAEEVAEEAYT